MKKLYSLLPIMALICFQSCGCPDKSDICYLKIENIEGVGIRKQCVSPYRDSLVDPPVPIDYLTDYFKYHNGPGRLTGPEMLAFYGSTYRRECDCYINSYLFWFDENDSIVCVWDLRGGSPDSIARWLDPGQWKMDSSASAYCRQNPRAVQIQYYNTFVFDSSDLADHKSFLEFKQNATN